MKPNIHAGFRKNTHEKREEIKAHFLAPFRQGLFFSRYHKNGLKALLGLHLSIAYHKKMIRTKSAKKIAEKQYRQFENLSPCWQAALGSITTDFSLIAWGQSGNGKSNFVMQLVAEMLRFGPVLYLSLEESDGITFQTLIGRYIPLALLSRLKVVGPGITAAQLQDYLSRPRTPRVVVIDSLQYLGISYPEYKHLRQQCPHVALIMVSHASGRLPDGKTADKIRYDAGIKVWVEKDIAFVQHSRYGGHTNYVIWEEGARKKRTKSDYKKCLIR